MEDYKKKLEQLSARLSELQLKLHLAEETKKLSELLSESQAADFWSDNLHAQSVMKQISKLEQRLTPWNELQAVFNELRDLADTNDDSLLSELDEQLGGADNKLNSLQEELKLAGPYDDYDAIMNIFAGAGGTDAQDWTQMLLRMYSRWAEKNGYSLTVIDQTSGEEAGIKSVSLDISGAFAYGKLKGEHGVHRLVRLSPFNADNLRQTSFTKVEILPKIDQPNEVEISDKDLRIDVFRSGGHGGQSVNTTDSAVRITHIPTNITISIQNERSQLQNKELAMTILRSRLAQMQIEQHAEKVSTLKGPTTSAEWGNQIRSYVLHPYKQVKDLRTYYETSDVDSILAGDLNGMIDAYLNYAIK